MARTPRPKPNDGAGAEWLVTERPDFVNEVARQFAINVRAAIGDASIRSVADQAGLDHNTLRRVLLGETWPDLIVIAKLERHFQTQLWPGPIDHA